MPRLRYNALSAIPVQSLAGVLGARRPQPAPRLTSIASVEADGLGNEPRKQKPRPSLAPKRSPESRSRRLLHSYSWAPGRWATGMPSAAWTNARRSQNFRKHVPGVATLRPVISARTVPVPSRPWTTAPTPTQSIARLHSQGSPIAWLFGVDKGGGESKGKGRSYLSVTVRRLRRRARVLPVPGACCLLVGFHCPVQSFCDRAPE